MVGKLFLLLIKKIEYLASMVPQNSSNLAFKWRWLILITILINACGFLSPVLNSNDAYFYAVLSKNLAVNHNWIDLTYNGQDWLDKPHLPFWLTALSFKFLGINSFAYILPGFLFHLAGAYYTYRLAKHLYDFDTGVLAALIYLTSLHLLLSAMDVRAEAYLLGEIMPACYYWLIYDREGGSRALLLASLFTGLAMMSKGIFVVVTIFSGQIFSWLYSGQIRKMVSLRWLGAYLLSLCWIVPELVSLYLQFDAHPEKIVFGHTHVSGLAWYFWGSQFGRFFNSGPIVNTHGNPLFFVHTFLWAFLPWSLVFVAALWNMLRHFTKLEKREQARSIYLLASFWLAFIMFSATKFQLDHYTNIIMPFAAIICANYLLTNPRPLVIARVQTGLSILLLILTIGLCLFLFRFSIYSSLAIIPVLVLIAILLRAEKTYLGQSLLYPTLAIGGAFAFVMLVNGIIYPKYDLGYKVSQIINKHSQVPIVVYQVNGVINSLNFHTVAPVSELSDANDIDQLHQRYLLIASNNQHLLPANNQLIGEYDGLPMEKFIPALFKNKVYQASLIRAKLIYLP